MSEVKKVKIQTIVESQIPEFLNEENPLFKEFLNQYYLSQEHTTGVVDLSVNINEYKSISHFDTETFFNYFIPSTVTKSILSIDDVINVTHTIGFPEKYGLIKIDDEIITYTSKTKNTFEGCVRGFSAIDSLHEFTFTSTEAQDHNVNSSIQNLNLLFYQKLFEKFKIQFLPGFENREFIPQLNLENVLTRAKDFYVSKGTDTSYKILFKVLYGLDIELIKPQEYMLRPSDSNYFITKNILIEKISGEGNPLDLNGKTIFQKISNELEASAAIYNVEYRPLDGRDFYELSLDSTSIIFNFISTKKTNLLENTPTGSNTLLVDSTVGFPNSGSLLVRTKNSNIPFIVQYSEKTINQFLNVSGIVVDLLELDEIIENNFAYVDTDAERIEFRVLGIIDGVDYSKTSNLRVNDKISLSTFGYDLSDRSEFNSWIYNIPTTHNIESVSATSENSIWTIELKDSVKFYNNESILLSNPDFVDDVKIKVSIRKIINNKTVEVISSQSIQNKTQVEKIIRRSNVYSFPEVNILFSGVQNIYSDNDLENLYVCSSGLPEYQILADDRKIFVSTPEISNNIGISKTTIINTTKNHKFYTGEKIYYYPSEKTGITTGEYYVTTIGNSVDSNQIQLSLSNSDVYSKKYVSVGYGITNDYVVKSDYNDKTLEHQRLLKKITLNTNDDKEVENNDTSTNNRVLGMFVDGVEIYSPTLYDENIYYGKLDDVIITNPGKDYDVINFTGLEISDFSGQDAKIWPSITGSVREIKIINPGIGYQSKPKISIIGGNGSGAILKPNLVKTRITSGFRGDGTGVNPTTDVIKFINNHNFDDGEEVFYLSNSNSPIFPLEDNSVYFVGKISNNEIQLYKNKNDVASGHNQINLVGISSGFHYFKTTKSKNTITKIFVEDGGSNYSNKLVKIPSRLSTNNNKVNGINTFDNYIFAKNHNFKNGDYVVYSYSENPIVGLSTDVQYSVHILDKDRFRLSLNNMNGFENKNNKNLKYINLQSIGVGTHTFSYPPIEIVIESISEISSTDITQPTLEPVVLGSFDSIFVESGGHSYGSPDIINFHRRPFIGVNKITSEAVLRPIISDGSIINVQVLNRGFGYSDDIDITITGQGSGAVFQPVVSNGRIEDINILNKGFNYSQENTNIRIERRGNDAQFIGNVYEWKINQVEKNKSLLTNSDEGILVPSRNQQYGLQFINFYAPKVLRRKLDDHIDSENKEVSTDSHSPIIGWSYDGYPIYGPYTNTGLSISKVRSGYQKRIQTDPKLRPIGKGYPDGFFIQDYVYNSSIGDLDEHNGKFVTTPEFPNGTYAYFLTIDNEITSNPVYPYVVGNNFKNSIIKENYNPKFNQETNLLDLQLIRNVGPYFINSVNSDYKLIKKVKDSYKQEFIVNDVESSGIDSISIYGPGENYKSGDIIFFDNSDTGGTGISAVVSEIRGKDIRKINVGVNTFTSTAFVKTANKVTGITQMPHGLKNEDMIVISSISENDFKFLEGFKQIIVDQKSVRLLEDIGSLLSTGNQISLNVNDTSIFESDDYIKIDEEILQITKISSRESKIYANRIDSIGIHTSGISSVTLLPRKFTYFLEDSSNRNSIKNLTSYFNPYTDVGIGSTGKVITQFDNSILSIPEKSIYVPNHKYVTGQPLTYNVGVGGVGILVSEDLSSTYNLSDGQTVYAVDLGKDFVGLSTLGFTTNTGIGSNYNSLYFIDNPVNIGIAHSLTTQYNKVLGEVKNYFIDIITNDNHELITGDKVRLNLSPDDSKTIRFRYDPVIRKITTELINFDSTSSVDIEDSQIYIENNNLKTGDKIVYYSNGNGSISNLEDNKTYFIIKNDPNYIKLSEYYSDSKSGIFVTLGSVGSGTHSLALVNPPLEIIQGDSVTIDVSDPSLLEMDFKLYKDINFKKQIESYKYELKNNNFRIRTSTIEYPSEMYYTFISNSQLDNRKDQISSDDDVSGRNLIRIIPNKLSREYPIVSTGNTSFKMNLMSLPEKLDYDVNSGVSTIFYTSNSKFIKGPIGKIKINFEGRGYKKLPKIKNIKTISGKGAVLEAKSNSIGKIKTLNRIKDGFDYPTDTTLKPLLSVPAVIQVKDISRVGSINIINAGSGYNSAPSLKVIGNDNIKLSATIQGGSVDQVTIEENVNNLRFPLRIVPTRNSNGYDIDNITRSGSNITLELVNVNNQIYPLVTVGYGKTEVDFPFSEGDEIFIEGCRLDLTDTDDSGNIISRNNYNSSNYDYRFFKVTKVDKENYTVTYSMEGIGSNLGNYTSDFGYGYVINKKNMPEFEMILSDDLSYFSNETVIATNNLGKEKFSARVMEDGWDNDLNQMRVIDVKGVLKVGDKIKGSISNLNGTVVNVTEFNLPTTSGISREKINDFGDRNGILNDYQQRISDNNYYQKFSYSIKSQLPYTEWRESVKSLIHPAGFKEFSDLDVISLGVQTSTSKKINLNVAESSLDLTVNIDGGGSMLTRNNFGMVTEEDQFEDGSIQRVVFEDGINLKSYILNNTNKVIPIDDISPEFTGFTTTTGGVIVGLTTFNLKNRGFPIFHREFDPGSSSTVDLTNNSFQIQNHNFQSGQSLFYNVLDIPIPAVGIAQTEVDSTFTYGPILETFDSEMIGMDSTEYTMDLN